MSKEPLFLETSILVCKTIKEPVLSRYTDERTAKNCCFSGASEYSLLEYYKVVIKRIDNVIRKLKETKSLLRARERIDAKSGASRDQRAYRLYNALLTKSDFYLEANFDKYWEGKRDEEFQEGRAEMAVTFLTEFKADWMERVRREVDHWETQLRCFWVEHLSNLPRNENAVIKCSRKAIRCDLVKVLSSRRDDLVKVKNFLENLPDGPALSSDQYKPVKTKELVGLAAAIDNFLNDPDSAAEYEKGCIKFADLLQLIDSKTFPTIYSTNYKEFIALCMALGKNFLLQHHSDAESSLFRATPPALQSPVLVDPAVNAHDNSQAANPH